MTVRSVAVAALILCLGSIAGSEAHELGKTQITATLSSSHTYRIDIVVDPDALLTRLDLLEGRPVAPAASRTKRDRRIAELGHEFLDHLSLAFDGSRVRPAFAYRPPSALADAAQDPAMVTLAGTVPAGVTAMTIGYDLAMGSYALNVRIGDGPVQTVWLEGSQTSGPISLAAPPPPLTAVEVMRQYFALGFTHILPRGLDHILFVLGVFLLAAEWRSVLLQISTFTLAHSITLALTMYGVVSLPARIVEPMIALSIAYVAIENLLTTELQPWRLALVFSFGLLHGMGFAGVLRDLGLPRSQFLTALVTFNAGVEAGQLAVIALATVVVANWRRNPASYRRLIIRPASTVIAVTGIYWTVQRVLL